MSMNAIYQHDISLLISVRFQTGATFLESNAIGRTRRMVSSVLLFENILRSLSYFAAVSDVTDIPSKSKRIYSN